MQMLAVALAAGVKIRFWRNGALGKIRTPDPQIRSLVLYPAELRARRMANGALSPCQRRPHHRGRLVRWQAPFTQDLSCACCQPVAVLLRHNMR